MQTMGDGYIVGTVRQERSDGTNSLGQQPDERRTLSNTLPIIEIFGPVLQGEGALIGVQTDFIRVGGCDYRCSWCDTPGAVDSELIRQSVRRLTFEEVKVEWSKLNSHALWITLSGGNPVLFNFESLVDDFHVLGRKVAVETQGSYVTPWLRKVDLITVSPKPPSSGMQNKFNYAAFTAILEMAEPGRQIAVKIPIASLEDLKWAKTLLVMQKSHVYQFVQPVRDHINGTFYDQIAMLKWLADEVLKDPDLAHVRVLPQMHALIDMR
jgi:7-carboxy-7-deazaguanine synthase